jgi:hypothetical protein
MVEWVKGDTIINLPLCQTNISNISKAMPKIFLYLPEKHFWNQ